jgi:hypothetical protein
MDRREEQEEEERGRRTRTMNIEEDLRNPKRWTQREALHTMLRVIK